MKRGLLLTMALLTALTIRAQQAKLEEARLLLSESKYSQALPIVNAAVLHPDTKSSAEAWYLRGMAYLQQAIAKENMTESANESCISLLKVIALKPDYGTEINNALYSNALLAFNAGVASYSTTPAAAYTSFMKVATIYKVGDGKRFEGNDEFAKLVQSAKTNAAYSAVNAGKDAEALVLLNELRTTGNADSNIYQSVIEIYQRQNVDAPLLAAITEAREHYPNSNLFRNLELNYYIQRGRYDVLTGKLEKAVSADPDNAELQFNLANAYERAAFPKDAQNKNLPRPANFTTEFNKAEGAYKNAVRLKPANPDYNYNAGVLYYEDAAYLTGQMNKITGMTVPEQKQYDELKAQRDAQFDKALPYFEAASTTLDPRAGSLTAEEKVTYRNALTGQREIYSRKGDKAKVEALDKKLKGQ